MIALAIVLGLIAALALYEVRGAFQEVSRDRDRARGQAVIDREAHRLQLDTLLERMDTERREAAQERSVLLNRIQDPAAGVASSLAYLPAADDLGVSFDR